MHPRALLALAVLAACGRPVPPEAPAPEEQQAPAPAPAQVTLTLENRDGQGANGYSFTVARLVPRAQADVFVTAFDCGARGRWVSLAAGEGLRLCPAGGSPCATSLPAGGTDPAFEGGFEVRREDAVLGTLHIARQSPTPRDWYEQTPIPPFEVVLGL